MTDSSTRSSRKPPDRLRRRWLRGLLAAGLATALGAGAGTAQAAEAEILEALWRVLAPGGKMLYATCSVFAEENGEQIAAFAARHPDCRRLPIGGQLDCQYLPCTDHDGFFSALLEKAA